LIAGFPIPIILALALNSVRNKHFKKTVQMMTYAPYFISMVVLVGMLYQFLGPKYGVVNNLLKLIGMKPVLFMGEVKYFRSIFVWSNVWQNSGWASIIYLSALASIDPGLHEAALVDGANRFKRMIHIDLPGIMPTMITLLILNTGHVMTLGFQKVLLMQNATNLAQSQIIETYVYKLGLASAIPQYSYATAIGLFNSLINFALILIVNQISKKVSETSLW
jgi:ABC-type polysaccharide transport system permease subunit